MQHMLRMGIDVGSTTVKVVLLDEHDNYLYKSTYAIMRTFWTQYIPCFKRPKWDMKTLLFMYVLLVLVDGYGRKGAHPIRTRGYC